MVEKILELAKEIECLQRSQWELGQAQKKIAQLEERLDRERLLDELLLPVSCPQVWESMREKAVEVSTKEQTTYDMRKTQKVAIDFLDRPVAVGYSILCTYDDPSADSAANESEYALFILVSDGRVIEVEKLGFYGGSFRTEIPKAKEILARKLPCVKPSDIATTVPQCLAAAEALSKKPEEFTKR